MEEKNRTLHYKRFRLDEPLPEGMAGLVEAARMARESSHSPYSGFKVGAAALLDDGNIIWASNQESSSFPASICAEHNLLSQHNSSMTESKIVMMAVVASDESRECAPCGVCRQVLADTENRQKSKIKIAMCSGTTATVVDSAADLLPFAFTFNPNE